MTARFVHQVFDQYRRARSTFVQTVADLASRPSNIDCLDKAGAVDLLRPLLNDQVPSIQQTATVAMGRLASSDERIAQTIVQKDIVPDLLKPMESEGSCFKKSALFVLRSISKHSEKLAHCVITSGGLHAVVLCLEDFDLEVQEAAAWAVGYMARHSEHLATCVVDAGVVPLLMLCLQNKKLCLNQIAASALCDISKHNECLAKTVVDAGCVYVFTKCLKNQDVKLKRQVLAAFASITKHSVELAESVVEGGVVPSLLLHLSHPDNVVKKNAASVVREICKHTFELSQLVVNLGGIAALLQLINSKTEDNYLSAILSLGYISGHSEQLAMAVIVSQGVKHLAEILNTASDDCVISACVWTLGQIGKHSPEHAKSVSTVEVLPKIMHYYRASTSSVDLKLKCKEALKQILLKCTHISPLECILPDAPPNILKYILRQFSKILPVDPKSRRFFISSGCLRKIQEIDVEPGTTIFEYISIINKCFPEEIVKYYSPGYPEIFLECVEQYKPHIPSLYAMPGGDDVLDGNETHEHEVHLHSPSDDELKSNVKWD